MTRPVKVAHVVWRLSPTGGIPRVVRDLAESVDHGEIDLHVISVRPKIEADRVDDVIDAAHFHSAGHAVGAPKVMLARAVVRALRELRRIRPDVVHLHSGTSWIALPGAVSLPR